MDTASFVKRHLLSRSCVSYGLYPAALIYATIMKLRRRYMFLRPFRSKLKVISIGNLTAGGSGKTPITIAMAKALQEQGYQVVVAHRGYKGEAEAKISQVSDGNTIFLDAITAGDEPVLLATELKGIPIYTGKNRTEVLQRIETDFPKADAVLLDDAFQHLKVARDLDIVVVDTDMGLGNGFCLPAGYLREDISAINRDTIVILHQKPGGKVADAILRQRLQSQAGRVFTLQSTATNIRKNGVSVDVGSFTGKKVHLISGIGNPDSFERSVNELGILWQQHHRFPDHYAFSDSDVLQRVFQQGADIYLCTAKDYVKLMRYPQYLDSLAVLSLDCVLPTELVASVYHQLPN